MFIRHPVATLLSLLMLASLSCQGTTTHQSATPQAIEPTPLHECEGTLHLVMLDEQGVGTLARQNQRVDRAFLDELAELYRDRYDIDVKVHGPQPLDAASYDANSRQFVGEKIVDRLAATARKEPGDVIMGLLNADMRIELQPTWSYAFSLRERRPDAFLAAVSSFRMTHRDKARFHHRLRVMISKNVATHLCGFPLSNDPTSVTYRHVMSPSDLDRMAFDLLSARPETY